MSKKKETITKLIEFLKGFLDDHGVNKKFVGYLNRIYETTGVYKVVLHDLTNYVISKKGLSVYYFARDVKGADIEKLTKAIVATKNARLIYFFARDVKGADIEKLTDAIIATKNAECIYYFAQDIKGANIEKLTDAIIATKNEIYIDWIAQYVIGAEDKLNKVIINKNTKSIDEMIDSLNS